MADSNQIIQSFIAGAAITEFALVSLDAMAKSSDCHRRQTRLA
jgi:hypothetical protein